MRTLFLFRADHSFLGSKRTFIMFQELDPRHQPYFALSLLWDSGVGVPLGPLPPARLSFGQHVALCCHLPPTGGGSESRGTISPAERPARRGGARSHGGCAGRTALRPTGPRRPLSLSRRPLPTHLRRGRLSRPGTQRVGHGSRTALGGRKRKCSLAALLSRPGGGGGGGGARYGARDGGVVGVAAGAAAPPGAGRAAGAGFPVHDAGAGSGAAGRRSVLPAGRRGKAGSEPAGSAFGRTSWGFHSSSRAFRHGFGLPRLG